MYQLCACSVSPFSRFTPAAAAAALELHRSDSAWIASKRSEHSGHGGVPGVVFMALCSEACVSASGGESSGSETSSSCLQFGVRSYLHHFYEECSASMWERDPEDHGFVQTQRSAWWNSAVWKVSLSLGLLILTAGIASLSVGYSTPHKIESFGDGDLFFVDTQAISFNRGLHTSSAAGIGLSCLGSALVAMGIVVWILPKANLKERLFSRVGDGEQIREPGSKWRGFRNPRDVITKPPSVEKGKSTITLSKVENALPTS